MDTDTELKISRRGALDANTAGGQAFRDAKSVTDCPYTGTDTASVFYAHHWRKGFRIAGDDA